MKLQWIDTKLLSVRCSQIQCRAFITIIGFWKPVLPSLKYWYKISSASHIYIMS